MSSFFHSIYNWRCLHHAYDQNINARLLIAGSLKMLVLMLNCKDIYRYSRIIKLSLLKKFVDGNIIEMVYFLNNNL